MAEFIGTFLEFIILQSYQKDFFSNHDQHHRSSHRVGEISFILDYILAINCGRFFPVLCSFCSFFEEGVYYVLRFGHFI